MHPPRILGILAAIAVLATGCTPSPGPTPVPVTPVPTCTPEFGGTPVACTPADHERMQQLDQRYADAERVYRDVIRLEEDALRRRVTTIPPELEALYDPDGRYLVNQRLSTAAAGSEGLTSFEGKFELGDFSRIPVPDGVATATLALSVCVDGRQTTAKYSDGIRESGHRDRKLVTFTETSGPRIWGVYAGPEGSCE